MFKVQRKYCMLFPFSRWLHYITFLESLKTLHEPTWIQRGHFWELGTCVLARHRHSYLSLSQTQAVIPLLSCFISHLIVSEPNKYAWQYSWITTAFMICGFTFACRKSLYQINDGHWLFIVRRVSLFTARTDFQSVIYSCWLFTLTCWDMAASTVSHWFWICRGCNL